MQDLKIDDLESGLRPLQDSDSGDSTTSYDPNLRAIMVDDPATGRRPARYPSDLWNYGGAHQAMMVDDLTNGRRPMGSDPVAALLAASQFYAPLTSSLVLTRGTGSATYTRATTAWEFDNEGKLVAVPSGIPRFGGARFNGTDTWYNTDSGGSPISDATLLGYHAEGARTNSLLYSRDLRNTAWSQTVTSGSELASDGGFDTGIPWTSGTGWSISGGVATATGATGNLDESLATEAGKLYVVTYSISGYGGGEIRARFTGTSNVSGLIRSANGTFTETMFASTSNSLLRLLPVSAFTGTIDNISVKEAAIQVTTCTGIDNAANSASTLTAGAADATILQTLTLAAAARSSSAYVQRRTGTGNVYFTRDGGTTWTDITASVGASWTRVKIENTSVLNPSIGFKLATSGDEIDVDCVQDEAGAFASSPIITTTAAVTRNADVLTYAKAGNFNDTSGSMLISGRHDGVVVSSGQGFIECSYLNGIITRAGVDAGVSNSLWDGTNFVRKTGLTSLLTGTRKRAASWSGSTMNLTGDGLAPSAGSYDGSFGGTTVYIGDNLHGFIKQAHIWQSALTDEQLQQVTA